MFCEVAGVWLRRYLDLPQRVQELVMAVGEHVQLVPRVSLRLLLRLRQRRLVAGRQLDVDLHVLQREEVRSRIPTGQAAALWG